MPTELTRRIRALFGTKDQPGLELVMAANALATLAIVGFFWLQLGLTAGGIAVSLPVVFGLLTACLLSRYTVWIAATLGSFGIAVLPARRHRQRPRRFATRSSAPPQPASIVTPGASRSTITGV
jgi:hypothetical protein